MSMANAEKGNATNQNHRSDYEEVIRSHSRYWIATTAISPIFIILGIWVVCHSDDLGGYTILAGASVVFIMALFHLPGGTFLGVRSDGLTIRYLWRTDLLPWKEIESFGAAEFSVKSGGGGHQLHRAVGIKFASDFSRRSYGGALRFINKRVTGFEAVLRDDYGKDCADLAKHLNQLRERYVR